LTMPRIPVNAFNSFGFDYMIFYSRYDIKTGYTPLAFPSFFIKLIDTWIKPTQILQEVCGTADGLISKFGTRFRIDVAKAVTVYCNGVAVASNTVEVLNYPVEYSDLGLYFVPLDNTSTVNNHVPKFANVLSSIALSSWITTSPHIYYNPNWELGVAKFKSNGFAFYCSNDLITWIHLVQKNGDNLVPEQYQHYRYWKTVGSSSSHNITGISAPNTYTGKNIVLASAPNNGAVITVTYTPAVVAKDANHVFDFSCELQFGEYTPPVV
ncbi:MAG: hypothetical protein RSE64_07725, partial [Oscillospiraceae bacterium]